MKATQMLENHSEWQKFKLGELFSVQKTKSFNKNSLVPIDKEKYPYVTRTSKNNGIESYTGFVNERNLNEANTFSLGLLQMDAFYQTQKWYAGQYVRKLIPKQKYNVKCALYFQTIFEKLKPTFLSVLIRDFDKTFVNIEIDVPMKNDKIDFKFMEKYINQLEADRIQELEAYLNATGLTNYDLTNEELATLDKFKNGGYIGRH